MDVQITNAFVRQLLEYFITDALGYTLRRKICDDSVAARETVEGADNRHADIRVSWQTDDGTLIASAQYDHAYSLREAHQKRPLNCLEKKTWLSVHRSRSPR